MSAAALQLYLNILTPEYHWENGTRFSRRSAQTLDACCVLYEWERQVVTRASTPVLTQYMFRLPSITYDAHLLSKMDNRHQRAVTLSPGHRCCLKSSARLLQTVTS